MRLSGLDDQELQDAAQACRSLAHIHSKDAERQMNPDMRRLFERQADRLAKLAQKFEAARRK